MQGDGTISHFEEIVGLTFLFYEKGIRSFVDTRLQDGEGTVYMERLDFSTMASTTFTIAKAGVVDRVVETNLSKCSCIKL